MSDGLPRDRRIALVTGASRGLGRAVAASLAGPELHLVLVARTVGGLEETDDLVRAAGGSATLASLDLAQFDLIDRLAAELYGRYGRLDVLVGNAGTLGTLGPLAHAEPAMFADVFALNVTANYRLVRALEPLLRRSAAGRAVFVTCAAAARAKAYWGPYASAKAALEALVMTWARELAKSEVRVNLFDPGPMRTNLRALAYPGEDPQGVPGPQAAADALVALTGPASSIRGEIVRFAAG
jgi:NAD(P)-dependent dehydrogenase (short-subunit alcohol dehydrogenase family)